MGQGNGVSWFGKKSGSANEPDSKLFCLCCSGKTTDREGNITMNRAPELFPEKMNIGYAACDPATSSASPKRHLVINLDVNKTVIMSDKVTGKTVEQIVNETLAHAAWGTEVGDQWILQVNTPSVKRPEGFDSKSLMSYSEWVDKSHPGSDNKKNRMKLNGTFTHNGRPGEALQDCATQMSAAMVRPDGTTVQLVPAFFELLLSLKSQRRSFSICFRTFGEDLADVAEELTQFCEGKHPAYPHARLDGSDGDPDYRFYMKNLEDCGTFHRTEECVALVLGTVIQAGEGAFKDVQDKSLEFYRSREGVKIIEGQAEVYQYLRQRLSKCGTIGLRDYFQYWKKKKMKSDGGKMFFYDPRSESGSHEMFFDDNLTFDDGYIIQPINMADEKRKPWVNGLLSSHLVRAEPLLCIRDENYFIDEIRRLEKGYEKKLQAKQRLIKLFQKILKSNKNQLANVVQGFQRASFIKDYDAWKKERQTDSLLNKQYSENISDDDAKAF